MCPSILYCSHHFQAPVQKRTLPKFIHVSHWAAFLPHRHMSLAIKLSRREVISLRQCKIYITHRTKASNACVQFVTEKVYLPFNRIGASATMREGASRGAALHKPRANQRRGRVLDVPTLYLANDSPTALRCCFQMARWRCKRSGRSFCRY